MTDSLAPTFPALPCVGCPKSIYAGHNQHTSIFLADKQTHMFVISDGVAVNVPACQALVHLLYNEFDQVPELLEKVLPSPMPSPTHVGTAVCSTA